MYLSIKLLTIVSLVFNVGCAMAQSASDIDPTECLQLPCLVYEQQNLIADDAKDDDQFGYSVSLDGNLALIGAPENNENGTNAGAAYLYEKQGGLWVQLDKLMPDEPLSNGRFGIAVDLQGDWAAIGAHFVQGGGAVFLFQNHSGQWSQVDKLVPFDGQSGDFFGESVSLSDDHLIVGAPRHDNQKGAAYVFKRVNDQWSLVKKIAAFDAQAEDYFGESVAIDGPLAMVGAPGDGDNGLTYSGATYVFTQSNNNWILLDKLMASDATDYDAFGHSLDLDGFTAVIGAFNEAGGRGGGIYLQLTRQQFRRNNKNLGPRPNPECLVWF